MSRIVGIGKASSKLFFEFGELMRFPLQVSDRRRSANEFMLCRIDQYAPGYVLMLVPTP
jgi:hypothetical protein